MKKRKGKTAQETVRFPLSEEAVGFIRTYILPVKHIDFIDDKMFDEIFEMAEEWELDMVDEHGYDKENNPFSERDIMGMNFVSEISGQDAIPDLNDLNSRLGLHRK